MLESEYRKVISEETPISIEPATTLMVRSNVGAIDVALQVKDSDEIKTTQPKTLDEGEQREWRRGYREIVGIVVTPKGGAATITYDVLSR